jgi:RND family efflux transporter MFP subunit
VVFVLSTTAACGGGAKEQKPEVPAKVQNAVKESDLATVTLAAEAERRLGIELAAVEHKRVQRARTFGGEVVVPPGQSITVAAPMAGRLAAPAGGAVPEAGAVVSNGQAVFRLYPLPSDRELLLAHEEVTQAEIRLTTAQQKASRAEQLLKDRAGSVRAVEEARAELSSAEVALKSARGRLDLITRGAEAAGEALTPVVVTAPLAGILSDVRAGAGQNVAAGSALFAVVNADKLWVRVPVYVGELDEVDTRSNAMVSIGASGKSSSARPVAAPPSADAHASSADLYYEIANPGGWLRPAQRVEVSLPISGSEQALTVPWTAVLHDVYGGTWVYVNTSLHVYSRRKVEVKYVVNGMAVLARGPSPGAKVVTAGAAELFGTEFSTGK